MNIHISDDNYERFLEVTEAYKADGYTEEQFGYNAKEGVWFSHLSLEGDTE